MFEKSFKNVVMCKDFLQKTKKKPINEAKSKKNKYYF